MINFDLTEANKTSGEELERLRKQLRQEQLLKMQAVNKLAEIMNRKDMSSGKSTASKTKVSAAELRKREKECRKLQQELTQVTIDFDFFLFFFILFFHDVLYLKSHPENPT